MGGQGSSPPEGDVPHDTTQTPSAAADPVAAKAATDKAVAEARKAEADALKAEADARSAQAKAQNDERDAAEKGMAPALEQRAAETRKATAEADKETAAAQRDQVAALIPDFSKIDRGEVDVKSERPLFESALAQRALDAAADTLAAEVKAALGNQNARMLVTADAELSASHGAYVDVVTGLAQLNAAADKLLPSSTTRELLAAPIISALAGAVPGLLSLFAAHRTVTGGAVTIDDLAAGAATAGAVRQALPAAVLVHDDFRLLITGDVHKRLTDLTQKRQELVGHKTALEAQKSDINSRLTEARETVKALTKDLADATPDQQPALRGELTLARKDAEGLEESLSAAAVNAGLIDSVASAIDSFVASLTAVPTGAKRSPLALAALREHLHDVDGTGQADPARFTHVLLVKGNGGSVQQSIDDKPLWIADKLAIVATASITYMLIETDASRVAAAGNVDGAVTAAGEIGDALQLHVRRQQLDDGASAPVARNFDPLRGEMP